MLDRAICHPLQLAPFISPASAAPRSRSRSTAMLPSHRKPGSRGQAIRQLSSRVARHFSLQKVRLPLYTQWHVQPQYRSQLSTQALHHRAHLLLMGLTRAKRC